MNSPNDAPDWDLSGYFPEGKSDIKQTIRLIEERLIEFAQVKKSLEANEPLTPADFLEILRQYEEIQIDARLLYGYIFLANAQDTSDKNIYKMSLIINKLLVKTRNQVMFFMRWWKDLPDHQAQCLLQGASKYRAMLIHERALKKHSLTESEQKIINIKVLTGQMPSLGLYDIITSNLDYWPSFLPLSERKTMGSQELLSYALKPLPEYRQGAYKEFFRVYQQASPTLAQLYQNLVRDWHYENLVMRHHESPIAARNFKNNVKNETVDSLLRVCRKKVPEVFGRYFKAKAKRLGLASLRLYDISLPLNEVMKTYTFNQALEEVIEAFRAFDPEFTELALKVINSKRLSAKQGRYKIAGAFCHCLVPGQTPWVFMNFGGYLRNLFTLAHELGHAVHDQLGSNLNLFELQGCLPLLEMASIFAEMLLAKRLRENSDEKDIDDLNLSLLDKAYYGVAKQAFISLFELEAHAMILQGATPSELSEAYLKLVKEGFGQAVLVPDEYRWEWLSFSQIFHNPFYLYSYCFGQLVVYGLWDLYQSQGPSFVPKFKAILAQGRFSSPEQILSQAGIGPLDDHFWTRSFEVLESLIPKD
jgi:oligoendopeptidase F